MTHEPDDLAGQLRRAAKDEAASRYALHDHSSDYEFGFTEGAEWMLEALGLEQVGWCSYYDGWQVRDMLDTDGREAEFGEDAVYRLNRENRLLNGPSEAAALAALAMAEGPRYIPRITDRSEDV